MDAVRRFAQNIEVDCYNAEKLNKIGNPITLIMATNTSSREKSMASVKFRGSVNLLYLAVGARETLTLNIWQGVGLTNGCRGVVRDTVYENGQVITDVPICIVVEWYDYIGPPFFVDIKR